MNEIKIDNYYEPESKTIRLDEADLNQIDTNTMQILLKENYKLKKENQELKEKFKATNKGLQKVVLKRKKWKHRYQLARCEIKELKEKLYLCTPEIPQNSHNNYISYVDLINKLYSVEKENDILLNVQEECEKSLHKIRELKKELNKVNDENKRLKEQIEVYEDPEDLTLMFMYCDIEAKDKIKTLKEQLKKCKKDINELRKDKLECYMKNTTILTSLNKFIEYLEQRLKEIKYAKKAAGSYESNYDYLGGKKNMTEEILTEFKNMVEEFQKTERVKK